MTGAPSGDRGEYRPIYRSVLTAQRFRPLSPPAKLLWFVLKTWLPSTGIDSVVALEAQLTELTGLAFAAVVDGLAELVATDWIKVDGSVIWLVDGLAFEPSLPPKNWRIRKRTAKMIAGLPNCPLRSEFEAKYHAYLDPHEGPPRHTPSDALLHAPSHRALDTPSHTPHHAAKGKGRGKGKGVVAGKIAVGTGSTSTNGSSHSAHHGASNGTHGSARPLSWPAKVAEVFTLGIGGTLSAGQVGAQLKVFVDKAGPDGKRRIVQAAELYVKTALLQPLAKQSFWCFADFTKKAALWLRNVEPGARQLLGDLDPDGPTPPPPDYTPPPMPEAPYTGPGSSTRMDAIAKAFQQRAASSATSSAATTSTPPPSDPEPDPDEPSDLFLER